ncbi:MAG: hypothetical protein HRU34_20710 [Richelia sp.]|nr:hypothetical protein [Richelia sp.]CDN16475.1 hypothetical protein RintRC_1699 [Richelia intracellularis]
MRDDFTKFSTIFQWFQTLIHPALMQRPNKFLEIDKFALNNKPVLVTVILLINFLGLSSNNSYNFRVK